jgi:hypothetical protein
MKKESIDKDNEKGIRINLKKGALWYNTEQDGSVKDITNTNR